MAKKESKLAQRETYANGHLVLVGLIGDVGYISIQDNNLYPDGDSRADRLNMNFNRLMIPLMTRKQLKDLRIAIDEVLKNSK
jgi:hypothetical protein